METKRNADFYSGKEYLSSYTRLYIYVSKQTAQVGFGSFFH